MIHYIIKNQYNHDVMADFISDLPERIIQRDYERWERSNEDRWFIDFLKNNNPNAIIISTDSLQQETLFFP